MSASLDAATFALQQIELHLADADEGSMTEDELRGVLSRVRILSVSTLVTLGVLGELKVGQDGKPLPVDLPGLEVEATGEMLRTLTAERQSVRPDS